MKIFVIAVVLGLPIARVLAWAFEIAPKRIMRTEDVDLTVSLRQPSKRAWIFVVVIAGASSLGLFFLGRYTAGAKTAASANDIWNKPIAVLPFDNGSVIARHLGRSRQANARGFFHF